MNGDLSIATEDSDDLCETKNLCNSSKERERVASTTDADKGNRNIMKLKNRRQFLVFCGFVAVLSVVAIVCLSVGVYRFHKTKTQSCKMNQSANKDRVHLRNILHRIKNDYFKLYPNEVYADPEVGVNEIVDNFVPYDPSWRALKSRTDHARKLRQELRDMDIQTSNLRPREKKAFAQAEHYLDSTFGNPYDENYYAGDWMLGPNYFCWQHICSVANSLVYHYHPIGGYIPDNVTGVEKIMDTIKQMKVTYETYRNNMVLGVRTGMVRSVKDCEAGYNAFIARFPNTQDGPDGEFSFFFLYSK